jgi:hypothetical protein
MIRPRAGQVQLKQRGACDHGSDWASQAPIGCLAYSAGADRCAGTVGEPGPAGELVRRLQPFGGRHTTAGRPSRSTREKDRVILPQSAHLANSRSALIAAEPSQANFRATLHCERDGALGHRVAPLRGMSPARHLDCRGWGSGRSPFATASKASGWSFGAALFPRRFRIGWPLRRDLRRALPRRLPGAGQAGRILAPASR